MIILGIDPGVERTGFSFFNKKSSSDYKYLSSGLIQTNKKLLHEIRLKEIFLALETQIIKNKPQLIILERIFFFKNQKTVIAVAQAQGVILLLSAQYKIKVAFLTPLQIKQTVTGYGGSDKKSIQKMLHIALGLTEELKQDDQADAIACAYAYCCINESLL